MASANGRRTMATKRVHRATLTTQVEEAIRADIIDCTLSPGQRLAATDLSERYGVSATPFREALQRLAADGLVRIDPRLGATVAPISQEDLHDTYRVRELLERLALEDSIDNADDAWEAELRESFADFQVAMALSRMDENGLSWLRAHRAFHNSLLARCMTHWVGEMTAILNDHSERYRMLQRTYGGSRPDRRARLDLRRGDRPRQGVRGGGAALASASHGRRDRTDRLRRAERRGARRRGRAGRPSGRLTSQLFSSWTITGRARPPARHTTARVRRRATR